MSNDDSCVQQTCALKLFTYATLKVTEQNTVITVKLENSLIFDTRQVKKIAFGEFYKLFCVVSEQLIGEKKHQTNMTTTNLMSIWAAWSCKGSSDTNRGMSHYWILQHVHQRYKDQQKRGK